MFLFIAISIIVIALDFYTKYLVMAKMYLGESIPILSNYLNLTYVRNSGAAFGFLAQTQSPWKPVFFWSVSVFAIVFLIYYYLSTPKAAIKTRCALSLLFGGALGNIIDRMRWGEVIDFIDVYWGKYHWPAFNIADSCICVGMGLLVYCMIRDEAQNKRKEKETAST